MEGRRGRRQVEGRLPAEHSFLGQLPDVYVDKERAVTEDVAKLMDDLTENLKIREGLRRQALEYINDTTNAYYDAHVQKLINARRGDNVPDAEQEVCTSTEEDTDMLIANYDALYETDSQIREYVKHVSDMVEKINESHRQLEWRWMPMSPPWVLPETGSPLGRSTPTSRPISPATSPAAAGPSEEPLVFHLSDVDDDD